MTAPVHEVIVGLAGDTRNRAVANRIADDLIHYTNEPWLIDVYGVHRDLTIRTARTLTETRGMLATLNTFRPNDLGQDLCITIEDATALLQDALIRANLEDILRARSTATIKFRFAVVSLDLFGFGGSKVIRDEVLAGNVIEAVSR